MSIFETSSNHPAPVQAYAALLKSIDPVVASTRRPGSRALPAIYYIFNRMTLFPKLPIHYIFNRVTVLPSLQAITFSNA
jgi:hypothetical protein